MQKEVKRIMATSLIAFSGLSLMACSNTDDTTVVTDKTGQTLYLRAESREGKCRLTVVSDLDASHSSKDGKNGIQAYTSNIISRPEYLKNLIRDNQGAVAGEIGKRCGDLKDGKVVILTEQDMTNLEMK